MAKFLKYFFGKWWIPILFWFLTCLTFGLSEILESNSFGDIAFLLLGIGTVVILISSIYWLVKRKWLTALLHFAIFIITIIGFFFYSIAMFWAIQSQPDKFAKSLKIPENIPIEKPIDMDLSTNNMDMLKPDSITNKKVNKADFQLYSSFQPGLYEYDFWTKKIDSGVIYLKAFEITKDYALSTDRLRQRSSVKVYNPTDSTMKFGTKNEFTIYEGDWGDPYAARFEVWFKPDNGGKERKLLEKNYIIEGWQR